MSTEAIDIETPAPLGVETPEVNETPTSTDVPEITPEVTPEATGPTDIDIYQDLLAKDAKDPGNYEMTSEELAAFNSVTEKVNNGEIEEPGMRTAEDKPAETPKPEDNSEVPKAETPDETAKETPDISMEQGDAIQDAMTKLGAKDLSELPGKIDGLINGMKSSGGKLGTQNSRLQTEVDGNINFMQGLRAKDPAALAHLTKITGLDFSTLSNNQVPAKNGQVAPRQDVSDFNPDNFLDDQLAPIVKDLMDDVKSLKAENQTLKSKDDGRDQLKAQDAARDGWIDDISQLVADYPDDFGLNVGEARALAKFYWSPEGAKTAVHPKFQKLHALIAYAGDNDMPNLDTAHVMLQRKNGVFSQKLIDAEKKGQRTASHTESPNNAISAKQGRTKSNVPDPQVTDDMLSSMEQGNLNAIPDSVLKEWTDENYNFVKAKVPERFHKVVFGKTQKF